MTPKELAAQASIDFPQRLKAARKSLGMTQDQLAEKAECSVVALSKFETGVNKPSFELLIALAAALETSVDRLLGQATNSETYSARKTEAIARLELALEPLSAEWVETLVAVAEKAK